MTPNHQQLITNIANTAKQLRTTQLRTQQHLADAMRQQGHKWTQTTVWRLENAQKDLRATELVSLANTLNTTPADLLTPPEEKPCT